MEALSRNMATEPDRRRLDALRLELEDAKSRIVGDVQSLVDERLGGYVAAYNEDMRRRELQLDNFKRILGHMERKLQWEKDRLKRDREEFEAVRFATLQIAHIQHEIVEVVVGGKRFETTPLTLLSCNDSTLAVALAGMNRFNPDKDRISIDRDPTHFEKILNFLREGEKSVVWMEKPDLSAADIKEVKLEAEYYKIKPLVRVLSWEVIRRESPVMNDFEACGFRAMRGRSSSPQLTIVYKTVQDLNLCDMNFEGVKFVALTFDHPVQFKGSVLKGAVFARCAFNAIVDFSEVDMTGVRFVGCQGMLTPDEAFLLDDAAGAECVPQQW